MYFLKELRQEDTVLKVDQAATESFQLARSGPHGPWGPGAHVIWLARLPQNVSALALFNLGDAPATISVQLAAGASCSVRDLWARSDAGKASGSYSRKLDAHSAAFVTLTGCPEPTAPPSATAVAAAAPLVGAIRWDAYFSQPGEAVFEDVNAGIVTRTTTYDMAPNKWHYRL